MTINSEQATVFLSHRYPQLLASTDGFSVISARFGSNWSPTNLANLTFCFLVLDREEFVAYAKDIWGQFRVEGNFNCKFIILSDSPLDNLDLSQVPYDAVQSVLPTQVQTFHVEREIVFGLERMHLELKNFQLQSSLLINTQDIRRITTVGQALSTEYDFGKLIDLILLKARELTSADGGSIYLAEKTTSGSEPTHLRFMRSVLILDAEEFVIPINSKSIAGHVALTRKPLLIDDVHSISSESEFQFNSDFDRAYNYHTKSMMTIPMTNPSGEIIGVIQLINRKKNFNKKLTLEEMQGTEVIPFLEKDYELVSAMAGQAAVAIENQRLLNEQRVLLESFIQLIAGAIDAKSPYTGAHCERVPILTMMLAEAACNSQEGVFKYFHLTEEEKYELKIAAWLHDCGKVTTPVHVMDKSTKLETIFDRIELVAARLEILRKQIEIDFLNSQLGTASDVSPEAIKAKENRLQEIDRIESLLRVTNQGGEYLADSTVQELERIASIPVHTSHGTIPLLTENEKYNLAIRKGTLTEEERLIINGHMVETIKMLEALPFPSYLKRVPEYAGGHHEKMDGLGYPKGLYGIDMSIPARIMAIADVFEALTAVDRPYKKGKTLSDTMKIMGKMKEENHLDPDLLDLFITSGVYKAYAKQFLSPELIDEVDEGAILSIRPKAFSLPPKHDRDKRWLGFRPEYQSLPGNP
jgi:HD-GYP domain-containing protein (c-di-GMP phosphodiesterase class II)